MQAEKTLDIIVPCFNPRVGWEKLLIDAVLKLKQDLPASALNSIILVNDGSQSGVTDTVVERLLQEIPEAKLIEYPKNRG
ncbi:MAG: hypothetical protein ACPGU4_14360, partial [Flavobacteriales bacterium]